MQARTAIDDTKRGYGLWRGEVLHPASPRVAAALASGEPITDTKGLGLRYVPVRGDKVIPHFRVHDPEKFSAALDRAFPAVHDAVVRLVAEDVRAGGFAALERWCASGCLPEPFEVWEVRMEMRCDGYRPDICVRHPEGGQIELEVINTHAPEKVRLDKAWGAGHIVLSLRIRDLVEALVFSEGRGLVPDDETLRGLLKGRRFALCGRESVPREVQVVWRDLNLAAYCEHLSFELKTAWRHYYPHLLETVSMLSGGLRSDVDDDGVRDQCDHVYDLLYQGYEGSVSGFLPFWWNPLMDALKFGCKPSSAFLVRVRQAETFIDAHGIAADARSPSALAVRRLRRRLKAMARIKRRQLAFVWDNVCGIASHKAVEFGWHGWIKRNCGQDSMPGFMKNLKGE
jgi:hypothetical protein